MDFLRLLEQIRLPFFDAVLGGLTYLGDELFACFLILVVLWCWNKKAGYLLFYGIIFGTALNQGLKMTFRIPRPWVLDPDFTIVENARAAATGYSFPSGHTACAVNNFGGLCFFLKKGWQRAILISLLAVVAFSRMYLGVHTPLDVGVSLIAGAVIVILVYLGLKAGWESRRIMLFMQAAVLIFTLGMVVYIGAMSAEPGLESELLADGNKNAWSMFGMAVGLVISQIMDEKHTHFETKAVWWAQLLKLVIGTVLVVGIRAAVKEPLLALCNGASYAHGIRYFMMALVGGGLYPMTFGWFSRLGNPKPEN